MSTPSRSSRFPDFLMSFARSNAAGLRSGIAALLRLGVIGSIAVLIHAAFVRDQAAERGRSLSSLSIDVARSLFPAAASLGGPTADGGRDVLDVTDALLGSVIQTAPESDRFLGFSGPTNLLIALDPAGRIQGARILASRDTRDHVALIERDTEFLDSWNGATTTAAASRQVDAVAGATLTSLAIIQGVHARWGATPDITLFPSSLSIAQARGLFPDAAAVKVDSSLETLWHVADVQGEPLGTILRDTAAASQVLGYQGPTESLLAIAPDGTIVGVLVGASLDNEPYVGYVRDDPRFRRLFQGQTLHELARLDPDDHGVEGVSGATMTSQAIASALIRAARAHQVQQEREAQSLALSARNVARLAATLAFAASGLLLAFSTVKRPLLRRIFQYLLVLWLGLVNGELLSMAMFVGWARSGIAWRNAPGLALLAAVAILLPLATRRNIYCDQLCPHGAVQQLLPRRWHLSPPWSTRVARLLAFLRPALLTWIVLVAMTRIAFSLVDIEPFDAYAWRAAAWPTITVAALSLLLSLLIPMGYCRLGCPTGALLGYLRRHPRNHHLDRHDALAVVLLALSLGLYFIV